MTTSTESDGVEAASPGSEPPGPAAVVRRRPVDRVSALPAWCDWLCPALLTLALGLYHLGTPQPWRDELASWSAASRSTGELFGLLQHVDAVSGAYYLLLHGWLSVFGDSPALLRLPSVLAMAGAAACVVLAARKLFDRRSAVLAGLVFAVIPSVSRYAQEARSYAFVVLATAAASWLLLRALERGTVGRWAPYAAAVGAAGLFHVVSLLFLPAHALVVAGRCRRGRSWRPLVGFLAAVPVALLAVLPVLVLGSRQVRRQIGWVPVPHLHSFVELVKPLFGWERVGWFVLGAAVLAPLLGRLRRPALEMWLPAALPVLLNWLLSHAGTSYFLDRYLLFTLPAWAVLAGATLGALRPRPFGVLALAVLVLLGASRQRSLRSVSGHNSQNTVDVRAAARVIADGYRPGDGFVPLRGRSAWMMIDVEIEYHLPARVRLKDVFAARSAVQNEDLFVTECTAPAACLGSTPRVWVVTQGDDPDPYQELPRGEADALRTAFTPVRIEHVADLTVSLLNRRS